MSNKPFHYQDPFPLKKDDTEYYLLSRDHVSVSEFEGQEILKVAPEALTLLAQHAFHDASFMLRPAHQQQVADILDDPEASENDKYVALQFLRNSEIAAKGILPTCQDTGTAIIVGKRASASGPAAAMKRRCRAGVQHLHRREPALFAERRAGYVQRGQYRQQPAGADRSLQRGRRRVQVPVHRQGWRFRQQNLSVSGNQGAAVAGQTENYLVDKMRTLGTAACPPYHVAFVIGGTSAEATLKTVKLASTKYYDGLPTEGNEHGQAFRDLELEAELLQEAQNLGLGAQFGGKYFAHDIRVVRLPRHGASCPVGMGVSCSADRNIKGKINRDGIWLEKLEHNPGKFIPQELRQAGEGEAIKVDLNRPMAEILKQLSQYPVSTRLSLSGTIIVGRDIAHAKLKERLDRGEGLPQYVRITRSTTPARPKRRRATRPVRWGQPPPGVWTLTSICCNPTAAA